jgi:hypothetical protein
VRMVQADLRDVDEVLGQARQTLDFNKPAGPMFVGVLHHILDSEDPAGIVGRYPSALAPGSYLAISHSTDEFSPEKVRANAEVADNSGTVLIPRSRDAILRLFNGHELRGQRRQGLGLRRRRGALASRCQYPPPDEGLEAGAVAPDTVTSCHSPP